MTRRLETDSDEERVARALRRPVPVSNLPSFGAVVARAQRGTGLWPAAVVVATLVVAVTASVAIAARQSASIVEASSHPTATPLPSASASARSSPATLRLTRPAWGSLVHPADVTSIGTDGRAGTLTFTMGSNWRFDAASGALVAVPGPSSSPTEHASPAGALVAIERLAATPGGYLLATELAIRSAGTERVIYRAPIGYYWSGWSPDGRFVAVWEIADVFSGSVDLDGRPLVVLDATTGARVDLGVTLVNGAVAWTAPHSLAYVAGVGREVWSNKTLRIWSPESGSRAISAPAEAAFAPTWSADGTLLYFVRGPSGESDPVSFVTGRGIGDRSIAVYDVRSSVLRTLAHESGFVEEGVRVSADGSTLLVLRRRVVATASATALPDLPLEIWLTDALGQHGVALVRMSRVGAGYYGSYPGPSDWEWTRAP